jgi:hypothetical protein
VVRIQDHPAARADLVAADPAVVDQAQVVLLVLAETMVTAMGTAVAQAAAQVASPAHRMTAASATEE